MAGRSQVTGDDAYLKRQGLGNLSNEDVVKVSKQLSWVLRRGARQAGVRMDQDGWVPLVDLVGCKYFEGLAAAQLRAVLSAGNASKARYEEWLDASNFDEVHVRAVRRDDDALRIAPLASGSRGANVAQQIEADGGASLYNSTRKGGIGTNARSLPATVPGKTCLGQPSTASASSSVHSRSLKADVERTPAPSISKRRHDAFGELTPDAVPAPRATNSSAMGALQSVPVVAKPDRGGGCMLQRFDACTYNSPYVPGIAATQVSSVAANGSGMASHTRDYGVWSTRPSERRALVTAAKVFQPAAPSHAVAAAADKPSTVYRASPGVTTATTPASRKPLQPIIAEMEVLIDCGIRAAGGPTSGASPPLGGNLDERTSFVCQGPLDDEELIRRAYEVLQAAGFNLEDMHGGRINPSRTVCIVEVQLTSNQAMS